MSFRRLSRVFLPTGAPEPVVVSFRLYPETKLNEGIAIIVRQKGQIASFGQKRRPRAVGVRRRPSIRPQSSATGVPAPNSVPLAVASLFVLSVIAGTLAGPLPPAVIAIYSIVSILTFLVYRFDKLAAKRGQWRTKESTLLLLGLACGWPGAVLAQRVLHHKSRKQSFQLVFWGTAVMNVVALGWLLMHMLRPL
jgi:uncharacterized membrane protein YsdA (DUF1294 family)